MGLLKNYEVINPFISSTTDSLNRLKPGFEAPICIVTSFGEDPSVPSRNRTILCGLIRDIDNPMATRFELRSPNPYTNTYTAIALIYSAVLDGLRYVIKSGKSYEDLLAEISKAPEDKADYLEQGRAYRSEKDVFEDYTAEERDAMFGVPPATVWENILGYKNNAEKVDALAGAGAFAKDLMDSFIAGIQKRWTLELVNRIVPANLGTIRAMRESHETNSFDDARWEEVNRLRVYLAKDSVTEKSLFTRIIEAINNGDFDTASKLQMEMNEKMLELEAKYFEYSRNLI